VNFLVVLSSKEPETAWNALRLASALRARGHRVTLFLMGAGVEIEGLPDEKPFDVPTQLRRFIGIEGEVLSCGTCLAVRKRKGSEACPASTMETLAELVESSDRVVSFG
jgi:uncharacterized protein involved in oxidation of intracellular sulfur